jgi:hypothetical protein
MEIPDLSLHLSGFYERVAIQLNVDPNYVRDVALGERESNLVENAIIDELTVIARVATKDHHRANLHIAF